MHAVCALTPSPPLPRMRGGSRPSTPRVHQSPSTQCDAPNETDVFSSLSHLARLGRANCVRARRRARAGRSEAAAASARMGLRIARLFERKTTAPTHAALGGADKARAHLREARAIPGDAAGRGRHRAGARSRIAEDKMAPFRRRKPRRRSRERLASRWRSCSSRSARRSRRPRSRRCITPPWWRRTGRSRWR